MIYKNWWTIPWTETLHEELGRVIQSYLKEVGYLPGATWMAEVNIKTVGNNSNSTLGPFSDSGAIRIAGVLPDDGTDGKA